MGTARRDSYGVPGLLGHGEKGVIPVRATEDGKLLVQVEGMGGESPGDGGTTVINIPEYKHHLVKTLQLDLSTARDKETITVEFDCLAIGDIQGTLKLTVGECDMSINKCLSMDLTAQNIQVSNVQQEGGYCEIWFFKKRKVAD